MKNRTTLPSPSVSRASRAASPRIGLSAASAAVVLVLAGFSTQAQALGFGRMQVHSALGQPLRAEVELLDVKPDIKVGMAPVTAYNQKGLDYNPLVSSIRTSVQQRGARTVLTLSSDRPMNDPFVDVVLQASDASGSVSRDFSILLDPAPTPKPVAPVVVARVPAATGSTGVVRERVGSTEPTPPVASTGKPAKARASKTGRKVASGAVRVRQGDTAGAIAAARKPANVSLDQMLLAMLRANPNAFINGNVNLVKAGAVLQMPTAEQARAVSASEARSTVMAQTNDFRSYRGKLARTGTSQATPDARKSGGSVQASVTETQTTPSTKPDALTLSKGSVKSQTEERIAKAAESKANADRTAELNKNLEDLKKLSTAAASAPATTPAPAASVPGIQITTPAAVTATNAAASAAETAAAAASVAAAATAAADTASAAAPVASASASASAAAAASAAVAAKTAAPTTSEPGFFESLMDGPAPLAGGVAILALLGSLLYWRSRKNNAEENSGMGDSAFMQSSLTQDSFFNASGGKDIDTSDTGVTDMNQSSMLYSPSQLDAEADVDPVSEADVYLAYGRDIQAEEILTDALEKNPGRVAIYAKLLEIYSRRRDPQAYANIAAQLKHLTNASGHEWELAVKNGAVLDPDNPLYEDVAPLATSPAPAGVADTLVPSSRLTPENTLLKPKTLAIDDGVPAPSQPQEIIDLEAPAAPQVAATPASPIPTVKISLLQQPTMSPSTIPASSLDPATLAANRSQPAEEPIDLSLDLSQPSSGIPAASSTATEADKSLEFDMNALSLDLDSPSAVADTDDGLETKFALAGEFLKIGDKEGARTMAEEVAKHAAGGLKQKAEAFLRTLG